MNLGHFVVPEDRGNAKRMTKDTEARVKGLQVAKLGTLASKPPIILMDSYYLLNKIRFHESILL